ncbi:hypothetical protein AB0I81_36765 [Nonomuraea sp. NPDC050404]|uniref:hypothetical protein n=1 Tax=Nonomuraea sp. NPDC050404 TaxID=3155783 RepID=UPI0033DEC1A0
MRSLSERTSSRYAIRAGAAALTAALTTVLTGGVAAAGAATDWASVVEPELGCLEPRPGDDWYVVRARVAATGDLTGDGRRETVVVSSCPSPTSSNPLIAFVYDGAAKSPEPRLLGKLGENRYFKSMKVTLGGGQVRLHGKVVSDRAPNCCPDLTVEQTYRWDRAKFRMTAERTA